MDIFFDDLDSLEQFTQQLKFSAVGASCPHCRSSDHLVSHGFIYKKCSQAPPQIVGKRVLCSNRYGHSGCGRTQQLYLKQRVPKLSYGADELWAFCLALMAGMSILNAYTTATNTLEPRNAYRWLNKCQRKLSVFRTVILSLTLPLNSPCVTPRRTHKLTLLVSTLQRLFSALSTPSCASFQLLTQSAFF